MPWLPHQQLELAALLNAEAGRLVGVPVSVVSLADVRAMSYDEYTSWRLFMRNRMKRLEAQRRVNQRRGR